MYRTKKQGENIHLISPNGKSIAFWHRTETFVAGLRVRDIQTLKRFANQILRGQKP